MPRTCDRRGVSDAGLPDRAEEPDAADLRGPAGALRRRVRAQGAVGPDPARLACAGGVHRQGDGAHAGQGGRLPHPARAVRHRRRGRCQRAARLGVVESGSARR
ncbi:hypothetical protein G6F35_018399 [Rhizopus arrhizus]|nr:hypothetical protein G6F35_018399 [Rhizopus arrhizus]